MTFRFLHLADLHLETHFGGRPATRERLRAATLEAFDGAVELALERDLHALLVAGDAFDEGLLSLRTELFLRDRIERLTRAGVWFLYACGNHDPGRSGGRAAGMALDEEGGEDAEWLERVRIFRRSRPQPVRVTDANGNEVGLVVGAGHTREREERDLAAGFTPLDTTLPVVGLLHTQVESAHAAEVHDRYAPSTRADYERLDYDYWALGHVHERQRVFRDLPIWYAGNLQGRHMKETGAKGGLVVEVDAGRGVEPVFEALAPVRWERVPAAGLESTQTHHALVEDLAGRVEETCRAHEEEVCVVLEPAGTTPVAGALRDARTRRELELELTDRTGALEVVITQGDVRRPRDLTDIRATPSTLRRALALCAEASADPELLERLAPRTLAGFEGRGEPTREERAAWLAELLANLDEELLERCLESDAGEAREDGGEW